MQITLRRIISSEEESANENLEIVLNDSNNSNNNLSENLEQNDDNQELNSYPTLDAHVEPEELINTSENDNVNDVSINETINVPEQYSNLSSHRKHVHVRIPAERCGNFIQHVNAQANGANRNILMDKKKNGKVISLPKVPLKAQLRKSLVQKVTNATILKERIITHATAILKQLLQ